MSEIRGLEGRDRSQIVGSSFWRDAKSPSRTGIARETRALPSRIQKCRLRD